MALTPQIYDAAEKLAKANAGATQLQAFRSRTYEEHGFPTHMSNLLEMHRYIDGVVNFDFERLKPGNFFRISPVQTDYTPDEKNLASHVSKGVLDITKKYCDQPYGVHFSILGTFGLFRVVRAIRELAGLETLSIFEAGPGTGYTGLFCALKGDRYASYDVTQGTYIWQSQMMEHFFDDDFIEVAGNENANWSTLPQVTHLPWWEFMKLYQRRDIKADVIISNANLGEMHPLCLRYFLRLAKQMLEESKLGMFVFGSVGAPHLSAEEEVHNEFQKVGFRLVLKDRTYAYALNDRDFPKDMLEGLENEIPLYNPTGSTELYAPLELVDFEEKTYTQEYYFGNFVHDLPGL